MGSGFLELESDTYDTGNRNIGSGLCYVTGGVGTWVFLMDYSIKNGIKSLRKYNL